MSSLKEGRSANRSTSSTALAHQSTMGCCCNRSSAGPQCTRTGRSTCKGSLRTPTPCMGRTGSCTSPRYSTTRTSAVVARIYCLRSSRTSIAPRCTCTGRQTSSGRAFRTSLSSNCRTRIAFHSWTCRSSSSTSPRSTTHPPRPRNHPLRDRPRSSRERLGHTSPTHKPTCCTADRRQRPHTPPGQRTQRQGDA